MLVHANYIAILILHKLKKHSRVQEVYHTFIV